jgi:hypothetical protein
MPFIQGDPVTQNQRYASFVEQEKADKQAQQSLTKDVAARVSQIYKDAPYIPASVILSMAKSGTSPETVEAIKKTAAQQTANQLAPNKPKKKGWFQELIYDNVKAASRWSFAGLSLVPDLVQNVASQAFSANDPAGFDGWFKSTQLGTLMSNTQEAGEGFFLGETAMEKQAERARRVRGTINGSAWTIGRGAAEVAFTPGSKPYAFLSGFIDAAVQIGADPTLPAGKALKTARLAKATLPGVGTAEEIANASQLAKGLAGLNSAEGMSFQASKFGQWATSDPRAKRLTSRIVEIASDASKTVEEKTLFMLENIPGLDPVMARAFAEADDQAKVLGLLGTASARLTTNPADVLLPTDIRDIKLARRLDPRFDDSVKERVGLYRNFRGKWLQTMPKGTVVINGTGADKTQAVMNYARYLRGSGFADDSQEFKTVMQKVVEAYSSADPAIARASAKEAYDSLIETVFVSLGGKSEASRQAAKEIIGAARSAKARVFNINDVGNADDGGALQMLRSVLPEDVFDDIPLDVQDRLVINGPGALIELADDVEVLPDFRRMRALAGNPWLTRNTAGGQRAGTVMAEFVQNEIWKPLTLATGGYVMRNMIDAQTRIAMSGRSGLFSHPQDFILWVLRKKGAFDITGEDFGGVAGVWNKEQDEFWQALTFDLHKNLNDPVAAEQNLIRNGNFSIVDRGDDAVAHVTGYVDNLALIHTDPILSRVAKLGLEGLDQPARVQKIKDWLTSPENKELLGQLRNYFAEGVKYTDPVSGKTGRIRIDPADLDTAVDAWVDKLSEFRVGSIVRDNKDLRVVSAYNRVPLTAMDDGGKTITAGPRNIDINDIDPKDIIDGDGGIGSVIRLEDDVEGLIIGTVDTPTGIDPFTGLPSTKQDYVVQPVHNGPAFTKDGLGTQNLRNLLDTLGEEGKLAQKVKIAQRGTTANTELGQRALQVKNKFVDTFFVSLYGKATQFLEKSPVFRQSYYREVFNNADLLAPSEAAALLARANTEATKSGMKLANYVGGKDVLARLKEVAAMAPEPIDIRINPAKWTPETRIDTGEGFFDAAEKATFNSSENALSRVFSEAKDEEGFVYHTTPSANLESISQQGIIPRQTYNEFGELVDQKAIYVSSDLNALFQNAPSPSSQMERLGSSDITVTRIKLPDNAKIDYGDYYGEGVLLDQVAPSQIEVLSQSGEWVPLIPKGMAIGTLEQLDDFAKASALRQTKELLYNATERSNLEDIFRIIIPFGGAWKEVMGTYAKAVVEDPTRLRKAQLIFDGARKFDPDNDGQGFFYRDATTGEYSFNFPLSGDIAQLLTGQDVPLQAPVQRLSIGLGVVPSIGPMAQVAASKIIPDTPATDDIIGFLLPYGRKTDFNLLPLWAKKMQEAWEGNTQNLQTVFGNTYIETLRALSGSGEYDLADPNEQEQLYADAKGKARWLTFLRAAGQFIGPTSPSPEFKIATKEGDVYGTQLVKEFQKLQANNYDTAVSEFLRIYGNDALLYISNKTESVAGGLEATEDFGDWERGEGEGLIDQYPDVAGFMAPGGDNFSFEVWSRQVSKGRRRRLSDREIVELAQYRAASAQYRALRDKLPPRPTADQKRWLRQWRVKLNKEYPGFPVVAEFNPGEFPKKLEQLGRLVQDNRLADNDVSAATRQYLQARDAAVERYVQAGGAAGGFSTAVAAAPLRDWLAGIGKALKEDTPEFARLYERLLSTEVEE